MASGYFSKLPKITISRPRYGDLDPSEYPFVSIPTTDILVRYKIRDTVFQDASLFYPYIWQDQDRPDTVAERYYGSSSYFWVIFYSNNAFDLNYDFPMDQDRFNRNLIRRYRNDVAASLSMEITDFDAQDGITQLQQTYTYTNTIIKQYVIEDLYIVDFDTYSATPEDERSAVTIYDWELQQNESKRKIQLLDNEYLSNVLKEFSKENADLNAQRDALKRQYGEN